MGGLSIWAAQWVHRQRSLWREHDSMLAEVWQQPNDAEVTDGVNGSVADDLSGNVLSGNGIVLPDALTLPDHTGLPDVAESTGAR